MRKIFIILAATAAIGSCTPPAKTVNGNTAAPSFDVAEVTRIENVLAADDMKGRKTFSPEIDKAAQFISDEYKAAGLQPLAGHTGFIQEFHLLKAKLISLEGSVENTKTDASKWSVFTSSNELAVSEKNGYEKEIISGDDNFPRKARALAGLKKNLFVRVDRKHAASFGNLERLKNSFFKNNSNVVFYLSDTMPQQWSVRATHEVTQQRLANVIGVIPGRSKANEYVIFSAHYDHIGIGKAVNGDSIYNGANDDASGVTATIMLARHFAKQGPQERTLVFAAFTAEEIGGYGSQHFSGLFTPASVIAMFNIEMIGTDSKWGKNTAFITGYDKSDLGTIMQKNLQGSGFTFHPDPYPTQQLFYRSDNATLARLGVPAHTISTAKMEAEPHYHQASDEVKTLDLANMAKIIEAIAISSRSVIEGKDTPSRVNVAGL
jgi:hypothetical protein